MKTGYQPNKGYLDISNPPKGGSGVPNKIDNIFISLVENPPNPSCKISKIIKIKEMNKMPKGQPKRDGSGGGNRSNRGRGGCDTTRSTGQGSNRKWAQII